MVRISVAVLLVFTLAMPVAAQDAATSVQTQIAAWNKGGYLAVQLKTGSMITGHLLSSNDSSFAIKPYRGKSASMSIAYGDVQSVKRRRLTPGQKRALIITGVVAGVFVSLGVCGARCAPSN